MYFEHREDKTGKLTHKLRATVQRQRSLGPEGMASEHTEEGPGGLDGEKSSHREAGGEGREAGRWTPSTERERRQTCVFQWVPGGNTEFNGEHDITEHILNTRVIPGALLRLGSQWRTRLRGSLGRGVGQSEWESRKQVGVRPSGQGHGGLKCKHRPGPTHPWYE